MAAHLLRRRRVVVTGLGCVTPLGRDVASSWEGLVAGRSGIRPITAFDPSRVAARIAGEVPGFPIVSPYGSRCAL